MILSRLQSTIPVLNITSTSFNSTRNGQSNTLIQTPVLNCSYIKHDPRLKNGLASSFTQSPSTIPYVYHAHHRSQPENQVWDSDQYLQHREEEEENNVQIRKPAVDSNHYHMIIVHKDPVDQKVEISSSDNEKKNPTKSCSRGRSIGKLTDNLSCCLVVLLEAQTVRWRNRQLTRGGEGVGSGGGQMRVKDEIS